MTVAEIFAEINTHMIEGIMLHDQFAEYYDFLNLHGFKRCHEYHAMCEFSERRGLVRYYVNHYNKLLPENAAKNPEAIPASWRGYTRQEVDASTKKRAIRDGFNRWCEWETETKKLYEKAYANLMELGEVAAACKVGELVKDVDQELKKASRKQAELASTDYDLAAIYLCQPDMHEKYKRKSKHIGVKMC